MNNILKQSFVDFSKNEFKTVESIEEFNEIIKVGEKKCVNSPIKGCLENLDLTSLDFSNKSKIKRDFDGW